MERLWEIDALRGFAVVLMVVYHFFFDLYYFKGAAYDVSSGALLLVGRSAAFLFVFLAGISMALSYGNGRRLPWFVKRGVTLFLVGAGITLFTMIFFPQETILFGVLHMIGLSTVLAYPFLTRQKTSLVLGVTVLAAGFLSFPSSPALLWLIPYHFATFDYFPLLPWFGAVLLGACTGGVLYAKGRSLLHGKMGLLQALGRNSLVIYLLHQPLLVALLTLF